MLTGYKNMGSESVNKGRSMTTTRKESRGRKGRKGVLLLLHVES